MPKNSKQVAQESTERVEELQLSQPEAKKIETKKYRYTGKAVMHFTHQGKAYMFVPNAVYEGLPECEQIKRLLEQKLLEEV